jgi:hypothetical protein
MAQKASDIEQASEIHEVPSGTDERGGHFKTKGHGSKSASMNRRKAEEFKTTILSFRSLQLRRIAELQNELICLSDDIFDPNNDSLENQKLLVDKALKGYGTLYF